MGYHGIGKKLSVGYNSDREAYRGCCYGKHSEMDAIFKLKRNYKSKSIPIDIYVTRVNKSGELRNSRPCQKCCKYMKIVASKKGYIVRKVFYPDSNGIVIKVKFKDLYLSRDEYISSHFIKKNRYTLSNSSESDSDSS